MNRFESQARARAILSSNLGSNASREPGHLRKIWEHPSFNLGERCAQSVKKFHERPHEQVNHDRPITLGEGFDLLLVEVGLLKRISTPYGDALLWTAKESAVPLYEEAAPIRGLPVLAHDGSELPPPFTSEQHQQLRRDVQEKKFDTMAHQITHGLWREGTLSPIVSDIHPFDQETSGFNRDGVNVTHSVAGVRIGYYDTDTHTSKNGNYVEGRRNRDERRELDLGIGTFNQRDNVIPQAQGVISEDSLERGFKGYYIRRRSETPYGEQTETYIIPFAYPGSEMEFLTRLLASALFLTPRGKMRDIIQRTEPHRLAA